MKITSKVESYMCTECHTSQYDFVSEHNEHGTEIITPPKPCEICNGLVFDVKVDMKIDLQSTVRKFDVMIGTTGIVK